MTQNVLHEFVQCDLYKGVCRYTDKHLE